MIKAVLFDLDGTLLHFYQDEFIAAYFKELKKIFVRLGFDAELAFEGLWAGTKAMMLNNGELLNRDSFWAEFMRVVGVSHEQMKIAEDACNDFYSSVAFDGVKSIMKNNDLELPKRIVHSTAERGFTVVLATNPLFPECAITTRLGWVGLSVSDFKLVTHYGNSRYCKPNFGYYREIFEKIGLEPDQCLMVGNSTLEDMSISALGTDTFLVKECIENESEIDISAYRSGTLKELGEYILTLQSPSFNEDASGGGNY